MAPPLESWPAWQLPERAQATMKDTKRKGFNGDLNGCGLLELVQYDCKVENAERRESLVRCWPIVRLFRRCQDRDGSFMVETTAWEGSQKKGG